MFTRTNVYIVGFLTIKQLFDCRIFDNHKHMFMRTVVRWVVSPGYSERSPSERSKQKIKNPSERFWKERKKENVSFSNVKKR